MDKGGGGWVRFGVDGIVLCNILEDGSSLLRPKMLMI